MSWSLKLITIRGIPIRVHASFLLILLWAVWIGLTGRRTGSVSGAAFELVFILLLFACVVLHELGHSLVAQLFGVRVQDITLWPVGGVARMARIPEKPHQEFLITAAGPATNVLLALLLGGLALVWIGPRDLLATFTSYVQLSRLVSSVSLQTLLLLLTLNNIGLALFNLIPAFPMDGGRLLRAVLAALLPFRHATRIASIIGQLLAILMVIAGLVLPGASLLMLIGLFVFMSAWGERQQVVSDFTLNGVVVRQAMQPLGLQLRPEQTLAEVAAQIANASQAVYLVIDGGRLAGMVTRRELTGALRKKGPAARLAEYVRRDFLVLDPDRPLVEAKERLTSRAVQAAIVSENGVVIGTLSLADLHHAADILDAHPNALARQKPE